MAKEYGTLPRKMQLNNEFIGKCGLTRADALSLLAGIRMSDVRHYSDVINNTTTSKNQKQKVCWTF